MTQRIVLPNLKRLIINGLVYGKYYRYKGNASRLSGLMRDEPMPGREVAFAHLLTYPCAFVEPVSSDPMVSETYFIEPVCEQSRGTPSGNLNSRDYDVNILQAANKWTMMEQVKNPAPGFKEVNLFINLSFFLSGSSLIDFILHR